MEFHVPQRLQPYPDIGGLPHIQKKSRRVQMEDFSFRKASMGVLLVTVLMMGGLYFFGSNLNTTAAARERDSLVREEISGALGEEQNDAVDSGVENSISSETKKKEDEELQNFDLLDEQTQ